MPTAHYLWADSCEANCNAQSLLPHDTACLLSIRQSDDKVKLGILERVDHNCRVYSPAYFPATHPYTFFTTQGMAFNHWQGQYFFLRLNLPPKV